LTDPPVLSGIPPNPFVNLQGRGNLPGGCVQFCSQFPAKTIAEESNAMPIDVNSIDLNSLSRKELLKLRRDIDKAIDTLADREKKAALEAVEKAAADHGFSLAELTGVQAKKSSGNKPKSAPRFRNPENPGQTWTGKGRKPEWFKAGLDAGKTEDDFAI
jgi:DNA-binding protein H-NS